MARAHPGGIVDLSVGTPVDPVPAVVSDALAAASDAPGYPVTAGTPRLREAAAGWLARRHGVTAAADAVLPVIGTKEFVAWLPTLLGLHGGDVVAHPALAYPTYDLGARLAGAQPAGADSLTALGPAPVRLIWVNSPSNPTGQVLPASTCARWSPGRVNAARWSPRTSATSSSAGTRSPSRSCTQASARRHRRPARRALAVQAVQHGRLPRRLRHR